MAAENQGRTLQTTATTLAVIEALKELDGAGVTELSEELDLSPSTVHPHLTTLQQHDYVVKRGKIYYLSLQFLNLGEYVRNRRKAYRIAKSYTSQLAEETEFRAVFTVEENGYGVYMYTYSGKHAVWTYSTVGKQFHLHQTAAGKAILAHLSDERVDEIIERRGLPQATENTITDRAALFEELEEIRERGVSFNHEEQLEGIKAIGAPATDSNGEIIGSFSVASPANRMTDTQFNEELPSVLLGVVNEFELENSMS